MIDFGKANMLDKPITHREQWVRCFFSVSLVVLLAYSFTSTQFSLGAASAFDFML